ncbi:hypothetical protein OO17_00300 [Rhodopseudomonas palustris]|uniref:DUF1468 domain-containing protein n=2 Tax=Nitrobacteraceae TaxID=41294 RepID=A0A0D7F4U7_RHOPL|nr:hypothetical protein OO17_00300 [Rhodopseudomonas palustris]
MIERLVRKRDFYAGALVVCFGGYIALKGAGYGIGTLTRVGSGFLPCVIGVTLVFVGLAIALSALASADGEDENILPANKEWLAWGCILASPVAFILFGKYFGLAPASFACVFVAAMGDREATLKSSLALAAVITTVGVVLFWYLLQVPMPLVTWRG